MGKSVFTYIRLKTDLGVHNAMLERKTGQGRNIGLHKIVVKKFNKRLNINQSTENSKGGERAIISQTQ